MVAVSPERHLLKAKDLADGRYHDGIDVSDMAAAAGLSRAHFTREFKRTFGEPPNQYLLARRLERAAMLLRQTDRPVNEICLNVGLKSVGSFTSSFTKHFGMPPMAYRRKHPPAAAYAMVPACISRMYGRAALSTNGEAKP
ncbi:MAG: helix-turn-helix transcriptional regulator [Thermoleophilaceae bacterium]|nr:helix-turn-helix transcriptional regulator [Thermoleophilaceae bacterium]